MKPATPKKKPEIFPYPLDWFIQCREEQYNTAKKINDAILKKVKHIAVSAPVKSGKREISEIVTLQYPKGHSTTREDYFLTSLNSKDCEEQIEELKKYFGEKNVYVGLSKNGTKKKPSIKKIIKEIKERAKGLDTVVIHFDELDYGSSTKSIISDLFNELKQTKNIHIVYYSATPEELLLSNIEPKPRVVEFKPAKEYRGAAYYLDNNLIIEAEDFIDAETSKTPKRFDYKSLSDQGKKFIEEFKKSDKLVSVVRFPTYYKELENSDFQFDIQAEGITVQYIDQNRRFNWSMIKNDEMHSIHRHEKRLEKDPNHKVLLVICQTAKRSTEIGFLKHIYFWHDSARDIKKSAYNTLAQAQLRCAHYHEKGYPIKIAGNKPVFELAAGRITYEEYEGKVGLRSYTKRTPKIQYYPIILDFINVKNEDVFEEDDKGKKFKKSTRYKIIDEVNKRHRISIQTLELFHRYESSKLMKLAIDGGKHGHDKRQKDRVMIDVGIYDDFDARLVKKYNSLLTLEQKKDMGAGYPVMWVPYETKPKSKHETKLTSMYQQSGKSVVT